MQRYELDPLARKLIEVDDGPWVFYADVEELRAEFAEAWEILEEISLRFKSGNSVMVDRASVNIDAINAWLKALAGEGGK